MKYAVVWTDHAQAKLADCWVNAPSDIRQRITLAVGQIDRELAVDPTLVGESRDGADRIMFAPPLIVVFEVLPDDRIARVLTVQLSRS